MRPNVLLVVLDGVRASNTTLHGYHRETTPFLREFAERATVYEQARAPSVWSLPSHVSAFTGLASADHGITTTHEELPPGHTVWEELAAERDYATGVFSANPFLTQIGGLQNAFDRVYSGQRLLFPEAMSPRESFEDGGQSYVRFVRKALASDAPMKSLGNGLWLKANRDLAGVLPARFRADESAATFVDEFLDWVDSRDGPWAACLNFMDAHAPYDPDPAFDLWGDERLQELRASIDDAIFEFTGGERPWWQRRALMALYDGCIRQMDHQLRRLVEALERTDELDDTLVVVTSDHGEGFGERSRVRPDVRLSMHAYGIHEVLLHVPLVVRSPGQRSGRRVQRLATLTGFPDAVRTILRDPATETPAFVADDPLLVSSYEREKQLARAEAYHDDLAAFRGDAHAVYVQDGDAITKHMAWGDDAAAITIPTDADRRVPDADSAAVVARELATYDATAVESADAGRVGDDTEQRLRNLGYL